MFIGWFVVFLSILDIPVNYTLDGANEYCQDKEHCNNKAVVAVHRINLHKCYNTSNYSLQ